MKKLIIAINAEYMKVHKSKVIWITALVFVFIPSIMALFFYIAQKPELVAKLGLIGTKASLFGGGNWQSYWELLVEIIAGIGLVGFGFITAWIFGREYTDHTVNDLLALPLSRNYIVFAKLIITVLICFILTFVMILSGITTGYLISIEEFSMTYTIAELPKAMVTALLTMTLCTPVAFFSSYGRGYLLAIGFIILTMILAQLSGAIGAGVYFPWAIPGTYSMPSSPDTQAVTTSSLIILFTTSIIGLFGTLAWWRYADQH